MAIAKILKSVNPVLLIASTFILCAAIAMILEPAIFHKFFASPELVPTPTPTNDGYLWDVKHYSIMALKDQCGAFYPLWPWLIRLLFHPTTFQEAARYFVLSASGLFFASLFPLYFGFKKALDRSDLALLIILVYSLNPMSIFRVIGYTEIWFSILSIAFIWVLLLKSKDTIKLFMLFVIVFLMSLSRPVLIQIIFSSGAALMTIFIWEWLKQKENFDFMNNGIKKFLKEIKITFTIWLSAVLGYSLYGLYCWQSRGNFFAPFEDQKNWGKTLGLHLELLFFPKSLLWDIVGLYIPFLLLGISVFLIYIKMTSKEVFIFIPKNGIWNILLLYPPLLIIAYAFKTFQAKINRNPDLKKLEINDCTNDLTQNYLFGFSIFFPLIHSGIVFFTQDRLFSLGRFVFATPFLFLALGYLCGCFDNQNKVYNTLYWVSAISAFTLIEQWGRYGRNEWLG
jgi:hypothetical protein